MHPRPHRHCLRNPTTPGAPPPTRRDIDVSRRRTDVAYVGQSPARRSSGSVRVCDKLNHNSIISYNQSSTHLGFVLFESDTALSVPDATPPSDAILVTSSSPDRLSSRCRIFAFTSSTTEITRIG